MNILPSKANITLFRLESLIDEEVAISLYKDIYNCLKLIKYGENQKLSFEFLYRSCYRLTLNRYGGMLYGGVLDFLINSLKGESNQINSIRDVLNKWNAFESMLNTLNDVLMYLEKNFVISNTKVPMKKIGMCIFSQYYLFAENRKFELINLILEIIKDYRFSGNTNEKFSKDTRFVIKKLYNLPSVEIDVKSLPIDTIDTIMYNDTCCEYLNKEGYEYVTFKSRIPIFEDQGLFNVDSKIMLFTFKYEDNLPSLNWSDHRIFKLFFESPFLLETKNYYTEESEKLLSIENESITMVCNYLSICEKRYFDEKRLVEDYLTVEVWRELIKEMDNIWILPFFAKCLSKKDMNKSIFQLFSYGSQNDLQRLFRIMSRIPTCFENLKNSLKQYILFCLSEIISSIDSNYSIEKYISWINNIDILKNRCEYIFKDCFYSHSSFSHIINQAFEDSFRSRDSFLINNWIALGFDVFVKLHYNENNSQIGEKQLEVLIWLFKFIPDKDFFESKYRSLLCKRLIEFPSQKRTIEHHILIKFRSECGHGYTLKLEGILADLMQSEILNNEYYQSAVNKSELYRPKINLQYHILTSNYWILDPCITCLVPHELNKELEVFREFFQIKYERRRLQWHFGTGKATILAKIKKDDQFAFEFSFECSVLQMLILDIFNEFDYISFKEIREKIQCNDLNFLKKSIFGLSCDKRSSILRLFTEKVWKEFFQSHLRLKGTKGIIDDQLYGYNNFCLSNFDYNSFSPSKIADTDIFCINFHAQYHLIDKSEFHDNYLEKGLCETNLKLVSEHNSYIQEDKCHSIDSTIVKLLKRNKTLHIDDIIYRTISSNNKLSKEHTELIISRINSLCQKEFISKDPNSNNLYSYIP